MPQHLSFCRYCHNGCGIVVDVEEGRAVRVAGDRENPVYEGYTCVKGRALPEQHNGSSRLHFSQKRTSSGHYEPIDSGTVMDEVARKLECIINAHGPDAVAVYAGTKASASPPTGMLAGALTKAIGSRMSFSPDGIDQPGKQVAKGLHGVWMAGPQGFGEPDVGLIVGANPLVSYSGGLPTGNPGHYLQRWTARGFKLLVIDPRRSDTARRAFIHLQARPGEDTTILAGMLRIILEEGLEDADFLAAEADGVAQLRKAVNPFTVDAVCRRADIPVDDLVLAARTFASARRGYAIASTGPNMSGRGTLLEYLVLVLQTVCGRWLRPGEKIAAPFAVTPPVFPAKAQAIPPFPSFDLGDPLPGTGLRGCLAGLPTGVLPEEILSQKEDRIRALITVGGNPAAAFPDQLRAIEALDALELLVSVDIEMSATAKRAHYVVAPKMTLEEPSFTALQEVFSLYGASYGGYADPWAQWTDAVVDPPEGSDVVSEWEFFFGVAQRMGLKLELASPYSFAPVDPVPIDMTRTPTTTELLYIIAEGGRIPLEEIRKHPRGALFPDPAVIVEPKDEGYEARLDVGNHEMMTELSEVAGDLDDLIEVDPASGAHPFRLISRRMQQTYNSGNPAAKSRRYNPAFMHPDDIESLGLIDGGEIEISSARASIPAIVKADNSLRRGLVSMAHAFGEGPERDRDVLEIGSSTSRLLDLEKLQSFTAQPLMSNIPVGVRARGLPDTEDANSSHATTEPTAAETVVARVRHQDPLIVD